MSNTPLEQNGIDLDSVLAKVNALPQVVDPVINPLSVTENGTYNAPSGVDGYAPVTVNVPQGITPSGSIEITENGTYDVTEYAEAVVDVSGGGGSSIVETTLVDSLIEEMSIYNVLDVVAPYTIHYKTSIVSIIIFCDTAAVGGSAYTNNRYFVHHNGTSSAGKTYNQVSSRVSPTAMLNNYNNRGTCYELAVSINSSGKLVVRSSADAIVIPVGAKIMVYELPLSNELWGE